MKTRGPSRRSLLKALGVASVLPGLSFKQAKAWIHGFSAPSFNGGKIQVNSNFVQSGFDYPFLNVMKSAQAWSFSGSPSVPITPDVLDSNGYLISQAAGAGQGVFTVFFIPTQTERPGNYILKWTGDGTVTTATMAQSAWTLQFTSVSQVGATQTLQMSAAVPAYIIAG